MLLGFGLCLLLLSSGALFVWQQYQEQITRWRGAIDQLYNTTHSDVYESQIQNLEDLSSYAGRLSDLVEIFPDLEGMADKIAYISHSANYMRQVRQATEAPHEALRVIEVVPEYLTYASGLALVPIVLGAVIILRARKKVVLVSAESSQPTPTIGSCPKCGYTVWSSHRFCMNCGADL